MIGKKKPLSPDDVLFFLHIPKCAGTSFIGILEKIFTDSEIYWNHYHLNKLYDLPDKELNQFKFIRGHFFYDQIISRLQTKPRIITFLRDPVIRFISNYEMRKQTLDLTGLDPREQLRIYLNLRDASLEDFLEDEWLTDIFANRQTRYIGGDHTKQNGDNPNIKIAKKRLENDFDFIGLTEKFSESISQFSYIFDFPEIESFETLNVSANREKRSQYPKRVLDKVAEINWADVELYELGLRLFELQSERINKAKKSKRKKQISSKSTIDYDFKRVDPGQGWHVGESHPIYGNIRWSGPFNKSYLRFSISAPGDMQILFHIVKSPSMEIINSLSLKVNDVKIKLNHFLAGRDGARLYHGIIQKEIFDQSTDEITKITFEVDKTISEDEGISENKKRNIGLCFNWLKIFPI